MLIKGYAAYSAKEKLKSFEYKADALSPYDVVVEITHSGICHSDIHLIDDDWNRSIYPLVPGHEVVGKIVEKGSQVDLKLNARVGISWLHSSCLKCQTCLSGENHICPDRKATCIGHHGGFAKHMVADSRFVYLIPDSLESEHAAPLLCAGATVYAPFRRLKIQAPHQVAIVGVGGLGHLAIQYANAFGCSVTAISSSESKKQESLDFGANDFVTLDQLTKYPGKYLSAFDYILSTTHADLDLNHLCSFLKNNGTFVFLGKPHGSITFDPKIALGSERTITGGAVASRFLINEMLDFSARHHIEPKIELVPMNQLNEAIDKVRNNLAHYRIVLFN